MGLNEKFFKSAAGGIVPTDHFNTVLYNGNNTTQSITSLNFEPDLIWIKERSGTDRHVLIDTIRGTNSQLSSQDTNAETTYSSNLVSFDTNGFTLGSASETNGSNETYVSWCWKANGAAVTNTEGSVDSQVSANVAAGFSIVKSTYTSTASYTVGHGLSERPQIVFNKNLDQSDASYGQWWTWIEGVTGTNGDYIRLNGTVGKTAFSDTFTTDTTIKYHTGFQVTGTNKSIISYAFHSIAGYQKIGSYTGTGAAGNAQNVGFEPSFVMVKRTDSSRSWQIFDSVRGASKELYPDLSDAEYTSGGNTIDSSGFTPEGGGGQNVLNGTYIYLAIA